MENTHYFGLHHGLLFLFSFIIILLNSHFIFTLLVILISLIACASSYSRMIFFFNAYLIYSGVNPSIYIVG